jgi:hypothetical protein
MSTPSSSSFGAFSAFSLGAGLSMMNNGIYQEIVWIAVDEPGEIDDHWGSELVLDEIEEPEPPEIGGADNIQEAHYETNPGIEPFKRQVDIPPIETESAISSNPEA